MKIEALRLRRIVSVVEVDGLPFAERQARPSDVYDSQRDELSPAMRQTRRRSPLNAGGMIDERHWRAVSFFVEIVTDEGVTGLAGPTFEPVAYMIQTYLEPILVGRDPLASEMLWDRMYRSLPHGRQGDLMHALSLVDCALWDLKGKWLGVPVYQLLGGKTRPGIPAYVSTLGLNVRDFGLVRERAQAFKAQGFRAQKWFFRFGPSAGREGLRQNIGLVQTVREAVGEDDEIMFDCWHAMNEPYVAELATAIAPYRPAWLEEVTMLDRPETETRLRNRLPFPVSGAEHQATRWGIRRHLELDALDIYQCDTQWAGGVSEMGKIAALVSAYDKQLIPHGASVATNLHVSLPLSPAVTPYVEYLIRLQPMSQTFYKSPRHPVNGELLANDMPGMGIDLDADRIAEDTEIRFRAA